MSPLRKKMVDDMTVRGLSEKTIRVYVRGVVGLSSHYDRSPDRIEAQEVQEYLLFLHRERKLTWSTCNSYRHGIRFFYHITMGLPEPHFYIPGAKQPSKLPEILNHEEIVRLFQAALTPKHRAVLMTAYAAGLRCSELTRLRITDIDSGRMLIRVEQGKGSKDRYVPLSPRLLQELRVYWTLVRPEVWLFPGQRADGSLNPETPKFFYRDAKAAAGITKTGGIHSLRHAYATDLLLAGVGLHDIQRRMGHKSINSTMRYLRLAHGGAQSTPSPLDLLELPGPPEPDTD